MTNVLRSLHATRRLSHASLLLVLLACLLITIRLVAWFVCYTCPLDFGKSKARNFHLHTGGDRDPCHHGQAEVSPLIQWACTVTGDESAYTLPEIPRLPVIVSLFVSLFLLAVSHGGRSLVAAHGRGPPFNVLID